MKDKIIEILLSENNGVADLANRINAIYTNPVSFSDNYKAGKRKGYIETMKQQQDVADKWDNYNIALKEYIKLKKTGMVKKQPNTAIKILMKFAAFGSINKPNKLIQNRMKMKTEELRDILDYINLLIDVGSNKSDLLSLQNRLLEAITNIEEADNTSKPFLLEKKTGYVPGNRNIYFS